MGTVTLWLQEPIQLESATNVMTVSANTVMKQIKACATSASRDATSKTTNVKSASRIVRDVLK